MGITVQSSTFDGTFNTFYHLQCYFKRVRNFPPSIEYCFKKLTFLFSFHSFKKTTKQITTDVIEGFKGISWTDQNKIKKLFGEKAEEEMKPQTLEQLATKWHKKALSKAEENEFDWQIREGADNKCSLAELKEQLLINNQAIHGGEEDVLRRFSQGCVYGAVQRCPTCKVGNLHYDDVKEKWGCHNFADAWSKCDFTKEGFFNVERVPFRINFTTSPYLLQLANLLKMPKPQPQSTILTDLHVAVSGRIGRTKQDLVDFLRHHSALFDASITEDTSIVLASENTVFKGNAQLNKAKQLNVPIVEEKYLDKCISEGKILDASDYIVGKQRAPSELPGGAEVISSNGPSLSDSGKENLLDSGNISLVASMDNLSLSSSGNMPAPQMQAKKPLIRKSLVGKPSTRKQTTKIMPKVLKVLNEADPSSSIGIALAQSFFDPEGLSVDATIDVTRFNISYIETSDISVHNCSLGFVAFDPICTEEHLNKVQKMKFIEDEDDITRELEEEEALFASAPEAPQTKQKKKRTLLPGTNISVISKKYIDAESGVNSEKYHILEENDHEIIYNVTLNQTELTTGTNSYYTMQLIAPDANKGKWFIWFKWGRVGTKIGSTKLAEFSNQPRAIKEFQDKFYQKTRNRWADYVNNVFVKYGGAYFPLEIHYEEEDKKDSLPKEIELKPSKLDPRVQDLMNLIFDTTSLQNAMADMNLDLNKMPLGKLSKSNIKSGYSTLTEIEKILTSSEPDRSKFVSLSNKFYTIVPHNFGMKAPPVIDNIDLLCSKLDMLQTLSDIEIASTLLNNQQRSNLNPIDKNYLKLNNRISPVDPSSSQYKYLAQFLQNSHSKNHTHFNLALKQIYSLRREGEEEAFSKHDCLRNKYLMWHGSRLSNWAGILSQGLRIAPPEAPHSGYKFGKGIYHANVASMSAEFGHPAAFKNQILLLISEVALGEQHHQFDPKYLTKEDIGMLGKHSTYGLGRFTLDPRGDTQLYRFFSCIFIFLPHSFYFITSEPTSSTIIPLGNEIRSHPDCPQEHPEYVSALI